MKKANIVLLAVTACFICVLLGIFIGRNLLPNYYMRHYSPESDSSQETQEGELGKLNINSATADQFAELPGIGPTIAQRIVDHREEYGPFETVYDLMDVSGIGKETMKNIVELITTGG